MKRTFTPEHRAKLSKAHTGKPSGMLGKKHREDTRTAMSKNMKGNSNAKGVIRSEETRRKMSEANKGAKCIFWKGGVTDKNSLIRVSIEYKLWREAVFKRDDYTCIWCHRRGGMRKGEKRVILNADHIKPFSLYPELRFAIDNGRTLCLECHKTTDTWGVNIKQNFNNL